MKLFGSKPDHPLADPKEAKRLLEALPANDAVKALDELRHWLESVAAAEGFKPDARIQLLITLDESAQPFLRKLSKDYFTTARPSRFHENRLWNAMHGYWKQAGYAFARSVDQCVQNVKGADAAKPLLPPMEQLPPDAPGRYAFANPDRVKSILLQAGFHAPEIEKFDTNIHLGATPEAAASSSIDAGSLARTLAEVDEDTRKRAREAVTARLAREMGPEGVYLAAACWLVSARA